MKRLNKEFYNRNTVKVAKELLGKFLIRKIGKKIIKGKIVETEAYCGQKDLASHSSKGFTPRTATMFGPPGRAYIYMIYGMYFCLNAVTKKEGEPEAVLIRGIEIDGKKLNGPGKICREFKIDKKLNNEDLGKSRRLWIESADWRRGIKIKPSQIKKGKRIGVDYAGKWKDKLWRFHYEI